MSIPGSFFAGAEGEERITAILDGKPVIAPPRQIQEARNAIAACDRFEH